MRIIFAQSVFFGVYFANKDVLSTLATTPTDQQGIGLIKQDLRDVTFLAFMPTLIFVLFFVRLLITHRLDHLRCMRLANKCMLYLTLGMLVLKLTVSHRYISNSILFFIMSCQTCCLYGFN